MPLTQFLSMIAFVLIAAAATVFGIQTLGLPMAVMGGLALIAALTLRASLSRERPLLAARIRRAPRHSAKSHPAPAP